MIRDHPWWGVGPGAFPVALIHYQRIPYISGHNPHNLYLEVAAEYGLPAALLVLLALGVFLGHVGATIRQTPMEDPARGRLAILLAILLAFAVHSLVDLDWSFPAIALTAATMVGLALANLPQRAPREGHVRRPWRWAALMFLLGTALLGLSRYYSRSLVNWSQLSLASGDVALAQHDLTWALHLNPVSFPAHQSMALVRLRSGDPGGAVEVADRAARLAPLDPNGQFLAGEIAASVGRWDLAEERFQAAVDRAPSAQLRFHAGLIEAMAYAGKASEARLRYERATEIFTVERVLSDDARCLSPGDRYLLAHLTQLIARLYAEVGTPSRRQMLMARARLLAQPDHRGICITQGRSGQTSPEAAIESFWRTLAEGGWSQASQLLAPGSRPPGDETPSAWEAGEKLRQARVAWIAALSGGEYQANLRFQLEIEDSRGELVARCAQGDTRLISRDWFLERPPVVQAGPCPE
jgi:tetratricopeptide (TPR) repeat protein